MKMPGVPKLLKESFLRGMFHLRDTQFRDVLVLSSIIHPISYEALCWNALGLTWVKLSRMSE